jgi:hypothetical protein
MWEVRGACIYSRGVLFSLSLCSTSTSASSPSGEINHLGDVDTPRILRMIKLLVRRAPWRKGRTSADEDAGRPLNTTSNNDAAAAAAWQSRDSRGFVTLATAITGLGVVLMFAVIAWALSTSSAAGNNTAQVQWLISNPWGIVSLVDLYTGFTVFSLWICFREASRVAAAAWVVVMMTTGWLGGSLYVLNCLRQFKGDWQWFFMGHRRT